jgi:hypothetical protein
VLILVIAAYGLYPIFHGPHAHSHKHRLWNAEAHEAQEHSFHHGRSNGRADVADLRTVADQVAESEPPAAQGVVFDAAYCNSPLCAPSRFTLVSGQLPSKIGAYDNAADFPADVPTYAHYLRRLGYRTALSGKMHFCGPDQLHGYEERLTSDIYPADYGWAVNWDEPDVRPPGTTTCPRCCKPGRACAPTSSISTKRWCSRPSSTCSTTFAKTATSRSA